MSQAEEHREANDRYFGAERPPDASAERTPETQCSDCGWWVPTELIDDGLCPDCYAWRAK